MGLAALVWVHVDFDTGSAPVVERALITPACAATVSGAGRRPVPSADACSRPARRRRTTSRRFRPSGASMTSIRNPRAALAGAFCAVAAPPGTAHAIRVVGDEVRQVDAVDIAAFATCENGRVTKPESPARVAPVAPDRAAAAKSVPARRRESLARRAARDARRDPPVQGEQSVGSPAARRDAAGVQPRWPSRRGPPRWLDVERAGTWAIRWTFDRASLTPSALAIDVRKPLREEPQHLDLPRRGPAFRHPRPPTRRAAAGDVRAAGEHEPDRGDDHRRRLALRHVAGDAEREQRGHLRRVLVGGDDHERHLRRSCAKGPDRVEPGRAGHPEVDEQEVEVGIRFDERERALRVGGLDEARRPQLGERSRERARA